MAEATVILGGEIRNGLTLSGSLQGFELKKFWSLVTGGEALPEAGGGANSLIDGRSTCRALVQFGRTPMFRMQHLHRKQRCPTT